MTTPATLEPALAPAPEVQAERQRGPWDDTPEIKVHPFCEFTVYGKPAPAGSKKAFALKRKDGSFVTRGPGGPPVINQAPDSKHEKPWKDAVKTAAREAYDGGLVVSPIAADFTFYVERGNSHYRTGKSTSHLLAAAARLLPTVKPDVLKLARAVEDALTGIVYKDDTLIVDEVLKKRYTQGEARVEVKLYFVQHATWGDWDAAHDPQTSLMSPGPVETE